MYRRKFKTNPDAPRQGQKWTDEEREDLWKEVHEKAIRDIAKIHQRTESAIIAQIGAKVCKLIADGMEEQEACVSMNFSRENYLLYCEIQEKYNSAKSKPREKKKSQYQLFKEWQQTQNNQQPQQQQDQSNRTTYPSTSSTEKTIRINSSYTSSKYQPKNNAPVQKYQRPGPSLSPPINLPTKLSQVPRPWTNSEQSQFVKDMKEQRTMGELAKKYNRTVDDLHGQLLMIMMSKRQ